MDFMEKILLILLLINACINAAETKNTVTTAPLIRKSISALIDVNKEVLQEYSQKPSEKTRYACSYADNYSAIRAGAWIKQGIVKPTQMELSWADKYAHYFPFFYLTLSNRLDE